MVTYPSFSSTYSACMILFFGSFEGKLLQKCLFHAGWMLREAQSSEQMVKSMQGTNKEAAWSKQVGSKRFQGGT